MNNNIDKKNWGYKMGAVFATTIAGSGCALIIAITIRIVRWMLF